MPQLKKPYFLTERGIGKPGSKVYLNPSVYVVFLAPDSIHGNSLDGFAYETGEDGTVTLILSALTKGERPSYWDLMYKNEDGTKSVSMILLVIVTLGLGAILQALYYSSGEMEVLANARSIIIRPISQQVCKNLEGSSFGDMYNRGIFFSDTFNSIMSQDILKSYFEKNKELPPKVKVKMGSQNYLVEIRVYFNGCDEKRAVVDVFNSDDEGRKKEEEPVFSSKYVFNGQKALDEARADCINTAPNPTRI